MAHTRHSGWVTNWYILPDSEQVFRIYPDERRAWTHMGRTYMIPRWELIGDRYDHKSGHINLDAEPAGSVLKTRTELGIPSKWAAVYKDTTARLAVFDKYGDEMARRHDWEQYIAFETKLRGDAVAGINNALHAEEMKAWERRRHALAAWRF